MKIDVLTLFPEMYSPLDSSIIKRAREKNIIEINVHNIRDFSRDRHKRVDDYPYGGGYGMVMTADPVYNAMEHIIGPEDDNPRVILMSPAGKVFNQEMAKELSREGHLIFICGHYEGIDERIKPLVDDEISIGDYVLTGGELASMVIIDSTCRLVPGVLGSSGSFEEESFYDGLIEYPQYTRPEVYLGMKVPEILLSGHHEKVRKWRRYQSLKRTMEARPDLLEKAILSEEDRKLLRMLKNREEII
jgi:tRNA (guanine37-N1)-methyltransferase